MERFRSILGILCVGTLFLTIGSIFLAAAMAVIGMKLALPLLGIAMLGLIAWMLVVILMDIFDA